MTDIQARITPALLKVNHRVGRRGKIQGVVLHATEGNAASVRSWFNAEAAKVSAHYLVLKDGSIEQFVREQDEAWHAGRIDHPTAQIVSDQGGANPNSYTVGIEHELLGHEPLTTEQEVSSIELVRDICTRHTIPIDRYHIVGHHEIYSLKTCPNALNVDRIVQLAAIKPQPQPPPVPVPPGAPRPKVVWSNYFRDWLIVTKEVTDTEWYFVTFKDLKSSAALRPTRGQTPLSAFGTP